jgi:hypothetical protein
MVKPRTLVPFAVLLGLSALLSLLVEPAELFARAGGGGSGISGGTGGYGIAGNGPFGLVVALIALAIFLYSGLVTRVALKRKKECRVLLERAAATDGAWDEEALKKRIEQAFYAIQRAWVARDQDKARKFMSDRLYEKHKMQTDKMIANKVKNILEGLDLIEAGVVQIMDYKKDSKDAFWAFIKASALDYNIDESTGQAVGEVEDPTVFQELWKFIRTDKGWVVDEIDSKATLHDLNHLKSVVEGSRG